MGYTLWVLRWLISPPMVDSGYGSYTVVVPPSWAPYSTNDVLPVGFFDSGKQFFPIPAPGSSIDTDLKVMKDYTATYGPISCAAGSHTIPHPVTGASCVCEPGFTMDDASNALAALSCHKECPNVGEAPSGVSCICASRIVYYVPTNV
eukprot:SAG11_NODE_53_length_19648_cov_14.691902_19_plen_148_part_00